MSDGYAPKRRASGDPVLTPLTSAVPARRRAADTPVDTPASTYPYAGKRRAAVEQPLLPQRVPGANSIPSILSLAPPTLLDEPVEELALPAEVGTGEPVAGKSLDSYEVSTGGSRKKVTKNAVLRKGVFTAVCYGLGGLSLAILTKAFLMQPFMIPSSSMEATLYTHDRILVEKWNGWLGNKPERGQIMVFKDPGQWLQGEATGSALNRFLAGGDRFLVKRVIGLPGDTIECCGEDGRMLVNGKPLDEPYLEAGVEPSVVDFEVKVPEGKYWVMGDNRTNSLDSRYMRDDASEGFVNEDDFVGEVKAVAWPISHWKAP